MAIAGIRRAPIPCKRAIAITAGANRAHALQLGWIEGPADFGHRADMPLRRGTLEEQAGAGYVSAIQKRAPPCHQRLDISAG